MARKPMGMPPGVELRNGTIRIRFTWNGERQSETLPYPNSQAGIAAASRLRDQVVSLNKLGLLDDAKYTELFPDSAKASSVAAGSFGEFAQIWMDSREIVRGTRDNYKTALNKYWMPKIATKPLVALTPVFMRKLVTEIEWFSPLVKSVSMSRLSTILESAVHDGLLTKNPMDGLELPKKTKKKVDPFTQTEADKIIAAMYEHPNWAMRIYAAYFEFAFYSGMRPGEILALRWDEVNDKKKTVFVCRIVADQEVKERTKTNTTRHVLLNERSQHALAYAKLYQAKRIEIDRGLKEFPYCFPPAQGGAYIRGANALHKGWPELLTKVKIRYRKPYAARHTYATMCLMAGMNPAFIANQLGHSVEMLLSTYANWIDGKDDWRQMDKLQLAPKVAQELS